MQRPYIFFLTTAFLTVFSFTACESVKYVEETTELTEESGGDIVQPGGIPVFDDPADGSDLEGETDEGEGLVQADDSSGGDDSGVADAGGDDSGAMDASGGDGDLTADDEPITFFTGLTFTKDLNVTEQAPAPGQKIDPSLFQQVFAGFDRAVDPSSIADAIRVWQVSGAAGPGGQPFMQGHVSGTPTMVGLQGIGFNFAKPLEPISQYRVALKGGVNGIKAKDGATLPKDLVWEFETGPIMVEVKIFGGILGGDGAYDLTLKDPKTAQACIGDLSQHGAPAGGHVVSCPEGKILVGFDGYAFSDRYYRGKKNDTLKDIHLASIRHLFCKDANSINSEEPYEVIKLDRMAGGGGETHPFQFKDTPRGYGICGFNGAVHHKKYQGLRRVSYLSPISCPVTDARGAVNVSDPIDTPQLKINSFGRAGGMSGKWSYSTKHCGEGETMTGLDVYYTQQGITKMCGVCSSVYYTYKELPKITTGLSTAKWFGHLGRNDSGHTGIESVCGVGEIVAAVKLNEDIQFYNRRVGLKGIQVGCVKLAEFYEPYRAIHWNSAWIGDPSTGYDSDKATWAAPYGYAFNGLTTTTSSLALDGAENAKVVESIFPRGVPMDPSNVEFDTKYPWQASAFSHGFGAEASLCGDGEVMTGLKAGYGTAGNTLFSGGERRIDWVAIRCSKLE